MDRRWHVKGSSGSTRCSCLSCSTDGQFHFPVCSQKRFAVVWRLQDLLVQSRLGVPSGSARDNTSTALRCVWEGSLEKQDREHWAFLGFCWPAELAGEIVLLGGLLEEPWVPSGHCCEEAAELRSCACPSLEIICMPIFWKQLTEVILKTLNYQFLKTLWLLVVVFGKSTVGMSPSVHSRQASLFAVVCKCSPGSLVHPSAQVCALASPEQCWDLQCGDRAHPCCSPTSSFRTLSWQGSFFSSCLTLGSFQLPEVAQCVR